MLNNYQQELVKNNVNLVYKIVYKFFDYNKDDLIQEGLVGLCKAAERFDITKGIEFSTFAYKYVYTTCLSYDLHNSNLRPKRIGTKLVKNATVPLENCLLEPSKDIACTETDFKNLIKSTRFNKLERTILYGFVVGYKKSEIATKLNLSKSEYNIVMNRLKQKLKEIKNDI